MTDTMWETLTGDPETVQATARELSWRAEGILGASERVGLFTATAGPRSLALSRMVDVIGRLRSDVSRGGEALSQAGQALAEYAGVLGPARDDSRYCAQMLEDLRRRQAYLIDHVAQLRREHATASRREENARRDSTPDRHQIAVRDRAGDRLRDQIDQAEDGLADVAAMIQEYERRWCEDARVKQEAGSLAGARLEVAMEIGGLGHHQPWRFCPILCFIPPIRFPRLFVALADGFRAAKQYLQSEPGQALYQSGNVVTHFALGLPKIKKAIDVVRLGSSAVKYEAMAAQIARLSPKAAALSPAISNAMRGLQRGRLLGAGGMVSKITSRLGPVAKIAGPALGVAGGALMVVDGAQRLFNTEYSGARGVVDRVMGGAGIVTGGAMIGIATGALALGPVGLAVVGVAAAAVGVWAVGNMVVDHWDDIKSTGARIGKGISDVASKAGGAAKAAWNGLKSLFGGG
ncbi:MAG: hypothetical protein LBV06_08625 [Propionibacteriaceae bacterium]|jgi:hypothetical protein|nr:hypothetical protein [Propionibacteriaceae bacterium]